MRNIAHKLQQLVPVLARAGQPAHLQAEDQPDVVETDLGEQPLEAEPALGRGPALALILVDDEDAVRGPAEFDGPVDEGVLAVGGFPVLGDLLGGGLADVDDGQPVEMPGLDLGRERTARLEMAPWLGCWRAALMGVMADLPTVGRQ